MNDIYSDIADDSVTQTKDEVKLCLLLYSSTVADFYSNTCLFLFFRVVQVVDHQVMKTVKVIKNFMKDSIRKVRKSVRTNTLM